MQSKFLFCHMRFLLVDGLRKAALVTALLCLAASAVSCRCGKDISSVVDTVVVHDTNTIFVHDTTKVIETRYDSVDREVEKIIYIDSNGVWHEKEKETLHHYIRQQNEYYKAKESEYKRRISELEKQLAEQTKVEYVEKSLTWLQETLMYLGVCFIIAVIVFCVRLFFKLKRRSK